MRYGLLGEKLGHSFSKEIHEKMGLYKYDRIELSPKELDAFMRSKEFSGVNVTIPYKQTVIPYLDEISERAKMIGAVNTIVNLVVAPVTDPVDTRVFPNISVYVLFVRLIYPHLQSPL